MCIRDSGVEVPYLTKYYKNTVVGYSYSKSLSLPGERIGYLVIPDELEDSATVITAAAIANRVLGSVNAPSLMQKVIQKCVDAEVDVAAYDKMCIRDRQSLYGWGPVCLLVWQDSVDGMGKGIKVGEKDELSENYI